MQNPKITALIRTHPGRETVLKKAINSCISESIDYLIYHGEKVEDYSYNLYCNELKSRVGDGYFFFLDSDDYVISGSVARIRPLLFPDKPVLVQMLRNGYPKPVTPAFIKKGCIGMPCMILHHSLAGIADITATETGDWAWIASVISQCGYSFYPIPLVNANTRSYGK